MEFFIQVLGSLGLAVLVFVLLRRYFLPSSKGLSSPPGLPIIGHLHLLGKLPHHGLTKLAHQYGPYMLLQLGSYPTLVLSSAEAAKEALKSQDIVFSSRPDFSPITIISYNRNGLIWAPYGDSWRQVRKLCTMEILSNRRVEFFRPVRAEEMSLFVSTLHKASTKQEVVDVSDLLSDLTFNSVTRMVIGRSTYFPDGTKDEDALQFKQNIREGSIAVGDVFVGDYIPWLRLLDIKKLAKVRAFVKQMDTFLQKQIDEHRSNMSKFNDFLSIMMSSTEFKTSDTAMKAIILDVFAGGTDTSSVTVEWGLAELLKNPDILAKAKEELDRVVGRDTLVNEAHLDKLDYLAAIAKETLRLHPPGPLLLYETTQDCKMRDCTLRKGTRTFVNAYAIARDPASWEDPLKFNPQRFESKEIDVRGRDYQVLPFGSGRRICPGIQLGMVMVQFMLATLIHGFDWKMSNGATSFEDLDMNEDVGLTIPRAVPLNLIPTARLNPEAYKV